MREAMAKWKRLGRGFTMSASLCHSHGGESTRLSRETYLLYVCEEVGWIVDWIAGNRAGWCEVWIVAVMGSSVCQDFLEWLEARR